MTENSGEPRQTSEPAARRVPIQRQIELRFPHFQGLVTGMSANLSTRGMFIQTDNPESAGTEFTFQFRIEDWSPIQGTAKVVWNRPRAEGPNRPAGMGVEFVDVDAQSRRMIHWLVERNVQAGGEPFDIGSAPSAAKILNELADMDSVTATQGTAPVASERSSSLDRVEGESRPTAGLVSGISGRSRFVLGVAIVIVAILSAYLLWVDSRPGSRRLRRGKATTEADVAAPSSSSTINRVTTQVDSSSPAPRPPVEAVTAVVQNWASAWESLEPRRLLDLYCPDFAPEGDRTRQQWEAEIEREMERSDFIRVAVSALEISLSSAELATASFYRSFRSNRVDESGRVVFELKATGEGWRIHRERGSI